MSLTDPSHFKTVMHFTNLMENFVSITNRVVGEEPVDLTYLDFQKAVENVLCESLSYKRAQDWEYYFA